MEVPLSVVLVDHPGLLQQVVDDVASHRGTLPTGQSPRRDGGGGGGGIGGEVEAGVLRCDYNMQVHGKYCAPTKMDTGEREWCD